MKCFGLEMNLNLSYDFLKDCLQLHHGDIPEEDYNTFWLVWYNIKAEIISDVKNEEHLYVLFYVLYCMNPFYIYTALRLLFDDKIFLGSVIYPFYALLATELNPTVNRFKQVLSSLPVGNYKEL